MARLLNYYRRIRRGGRYDGNTLNLPPLKAETPRPSWKARNPSERQEMINWVIQQLEKAEYVDILADGTARLTTWWVIPDNPNAAPAQQTCRGRPILRKRDALTDAADTVPLIREIWRDDYGRKNRHRDDGASAEEIAATLFDVNIDHVISRSRKPSGSKRRARRPA
jgi:hypothetical protein